MNLAVASFTVSATSNYMVELSSASVGLRSKGRPLLLDQQEDDNKKTRGHHGGDVALERARERACTKASASAAAESVRKYGSGGGRVL